MQDIKLITEEGHFKFRVCGIVKVNNKYLTTRIKNGDFYCLPGGHVEIGEDSDATVLREMKEELGYEVKIIKLIAIIQNFYKENGVLFHELGYYYLVEPKDLSNVTLEDYVRMENDKGQIRRLEFHWLTLEELNKVNFYPRELKRKLVDTTLENIINRD